MRKAAILFAVILILAGLGSAQDYHFQPLSPCIDAGTWWTYTISAGSGMALPVLDTWSFFPGDKVQFEGTKKAIVIASIDRDKNILQLEEPTSWTAKQGVCQPFFGEAPDIGAFEFNPAEAPDSGFAVYARGITDAGLKVVPGTTVEVMVSVRSFGGWTGKALLSCVGLPAGMTVEFLPNPVQVEANYFARARFRARAPKETALQKVNIEFKAVEQK